MHPLLTGHTRRAPLVEIKYAGLPVVKASMEMTVQQIVRNKSFSICASDNFNRKQGHYNDRRICEMMILNEIHYNLATCR